MRLRVVISEAVRSIAANLSTTFAAILTVLIAMFILGLAIGLGTWTLSWSNHVKKELLVKVFFCTPRRPAAKATRRPPRSTPCASNCSRWTR